MSSKQNIDITTDALVFLPSGNSYQLLLIKRKNEPFKNQWAIPGGFVEDNETLEKAAIRELKEETDIDLKSMTKLDIFDAVDRDPRKRIVTVAFYKILDFDSEAKIKASSDAEEAKWFDITQLPELAFDHALIIKKAVEKFT